MLVAVAVARELTRPEQEELEVRQLVAPVEMLGLSLGVLELQIQEVVVVAAELLALAQGGLVGMVDLVL
jgi:hypothetical protein